MAMLRLDGSRLHVLHLIPPRPSTVVFYEFERSPYLGYWDVVSLEQRDENPLVLELRLLHIDEEMLTDDQDEQDNLHVLSDREPAGPFRFDAFNQAQGFMTPTPAEFTEFIQLLEMWSGMLLPDIDDGVARFRQVEREEFAHWHVKQSNPKAERGWYQYLPDREINGGDEISLVHPPRWQANSRYSMEQHGYFSVVTFKRQRLIDPGFDPLDVWGLGHIVLNRPALRELVSLLKQHSFEYMVGEFEP